MPESIAIPTLLAAQAAYLNAPRSNKVNLMVIGKSGVGKTTLLASMPKPIWVDSFDAGGSKVLRKFIEAGEVFVDAQYEDETRRFPKAYQAWRKNFTERSRTDFFHVLGTYCVDSCTSWLDSLMNDGVVRKRGPGGNPEWSDYTKVGMDSVSDVIEMCNLPCHFAMTGHIDLERDELVGQIQSSLLTVGRYGRERIPKLFDEFYVMQADDTPQGPKRYLLTDPMGFFVAKNRLKSLIPDLPLKIEPNISKYLELAGYDVNSKWDAFRAALPVPPAVQ